MLEKNLLLTLGSQTLSEMPHSQNNNFIELWEEHGDENSRAATAVLVQSWSLLYVLHHVRGTLSGPRFGLACLCGDVRVVLKRHVRDDVKRCQPQPCLLPDFPVTPNGHCESMSRREGLNRALAFHIINHELHTTACSSFRQPRPRMNADEQ